MKEDGGAFGEVCGHQEEQGGASAGVQSEIRAGKAVRSVDEPLPRSSHAHHEVKVGAIHLAAAPSGMPLLFTPQQADWASIHTDL